MRTNSELSVVCESAFVPPQFKNEPGWLAIEAEGPFPFDLTGILAAIIQPLALAAIPIFALSTFDTDYVLIKKHDLDNAVEILRSCGHELSFEELYSDRSQR